SDAGAVDERVQTAVRFEGHGDRSAAVGFARDVGESEYSGGAEIAGKNLTGFTIEIGEDDAAAAFDEHAGGCAAEAGGSAGDEKDVILNLHVRVPHDTLDAGPAKTLCDNTSGLRWR